MAGWEKTCVWKPEDWLAHAYTIAISRLEGLLGKSMEIIPYEKLLTPAKERSLAALDVGEEFLADLLKRPTHAWKHLHKGSDLLRDWDTFNMKKAALIAKQGDTDLHSEGEVSIPENQKPRTRKAFNEPSNPTTPSPTKKKKASVDGSSSNLSDESIRTPISDSATNQLWERIHAAHKEHGRLKALLEKVNESELDLKKRVATLECEASASEQLAAHLKVCLKFLKQF